MVENDVRYRNLDVRRLNANEQGIAPRESARRWIDEFITKPHELIGRAGAVCPFVEPSMRAGTFHLEEWPVAADISVEGLAQMTRRMADTFQAAQWTGRHRTLHTLVVVLLGLPETSYGLLDEVHSMVKPGLVNRGLMLGQFHPECDERAARNPDFKVSRAPVPMLAMRHIAFHDVLFLSSDPECFRAYEELYGARYERGTVPDPMFAEIVAQARQKWSD